MSLPGIKAVLLDVDGTLVDSNEYHADSWVAALAEAGHRIEHRQVRPLIGKGGDKLLAELCGLSGDSAEGKKISEAAGKILRERYLKQVRPTNGARDLLVTLKASGMVLVVATSGEKQALDGLLRQAKLDDLIDETVSSTDVENSKPDPDLVAAALQKAGVRANEAVMVGDTPYDIEAARRAGVRTIALRCGGWWDDAALQGAVALFDDPSELAEHWSELLAPSAA